MNSFQTIIIHTLRKIRLKKRMFIGFFLVSVLPFTILAISVSAGYYMSIVKKHQQQSLQTASEMQYRIELLTEKQFQTLNEFSSNIDIIKILRKLELHSDPVENALSEKDLQIQLLSRLNKGSKQIRAEILNRKGQPITGIFDEYYSDITQEARESTINGNNRMQLWNGISYTHSDKGETILVFSREIINFFNGSRLGWVIVYTTTEELKQTLLQIRTDSAMAIYGKDGGKIYSSRQHMESDPSELEAIFKETAEKKTNYQWITAGKNKALVNYDQSLGWLQVVFPNTSELKHLTKNILLCVTAIYVFFIAIILYLSLIVTRTVTDPLNQIQTGMKKFSAGDLKARVQDDGGDELAELAREFNHMSSSIERLTSEVYQAQSKEKEAVLHALEAQINPHFLYNTLDMVNWMSYRSSNKDACNVIKCLSDFFRLSLNQGREIYTIADELRHVECYTTIEQYKKTQIHFCIYADPEILKCPCPKLIVQPLVENALIHGLEPKKYKGTIKISFIKDGNTIKISVKDDGVGLGYQAKTSTEYHKSSYGLANINERLKMIYNSSCQVELFECSEGGVTSMIRLPMQTPREGSPCI